MKNEAFIYLIIGLILFSSTVHAEWQPTCYANCAPECSTDCMYDCGLTGDSSIGGCINELNRGIKDFSNDLKSSINSTTQAIADIANGIVSLPSRIFTAGYDFLREKLHIWRLGFGIDDTVLNNFINFFWWLIGVIIAIVVCLILTLFFGSFLIFWTVQAFIVIIAFGGHKSNKWQELMKFIKLEVKFVRWDLDLLEKFISVVVNWRSWFKRTN